MPVMPNCSHNRDDECIMDVQTTRLADYMDPAWNSRCKYRMERFTDDLLRVLGTAGQWHSLLRYNWSSASDRRGRPGSRLEGASPSGSGAGCACQSSIFRLRSSRLLKSSV